jgi:hypothetical protein
MYSDICSEVVVVILLSIQVALSSDLATEDRVLLS